MPSASVRSRRGKRIRSDSEAEFYAAPTYCWRGAGAGELGEMNRTYVNRLEQRRQYIPLHHCCVKKLVGHPTAPRRDAGALRRHARSWGARVTWKLTAMPTERDKPGYCSFITATAPGALRNGGVEPGGPVYTNPRLALEKLPIFGKIAGSWAALTPNHRASVAAYCTLPVVGTQRPLVPESSGPPSASVGKVP